MTAAGTPGSLEVGGFKSLFLRRSRTSARSAAAGSDGSSNAETPARGRNAGPRRCRRPAALRQRTARGREHAAHLSRCFLPFPPAAPPTPFPGELSREKPEEDGRALFFGLRPRWRWPRRGPGSRCRGSLSTSSPQRARVLSSPARAGSSSPGRCVRPGRGGSRRVPAAPAAPGRRSNRLLPPALSAPDLLPAPGGDDRREDPLAAEGPQAQQRRGGPAGAWG